MTRKRAVTISFLLYPARGSVEITPVSGKMPTKNGAHYCVLVMTLVMIIYSVGHNYHC